MVRSKRTKRFRQLFDALPEDAKDQAEAAYALFKENPQHGSLNFKHVPTAGKDMYSADIGAHYRVLGALRGDTIYWDWIGSHETYNRIVKQRR